MLILTVVVVSAEKIPSVLAIDSGSREQRYCCCGTVLYCTALYSVLWCTVTAHQHHLSSHIWQSFPINIWIFNNINIIHGGRENSWFWRWGFSPTYHLARVFYERGRYWAIKINIFHLTNLNLSRAAVLASKRRSEERPKLDCPLQPPLEPSPPLSPAAPVMTSAWDSWLFSHSSFRQCPALRTSISHRTSWTENPLMWILTAPMTTRNLHGQTEFWSRVIELCCKKNSKCWK